MSSDSCSTYPPFSVAMSVYEKDNPQWLDEALKSVFEQTVKPSEVFLVLDGPVPNDLRRVVDQYVEKYNREAETLRVFPLATNGGLGNALRVAVENCKYDLIARMDSDDISRPTRFEEQLEFLARRPEVDVVGGDIAEFIDEPSNVVGKRVLPQDEREFAKYLKGRNPLNHVTVMFKKEAVLNAGNYMDLSYYEDYYLWVRMYLNGSRMANMGKILVDVRVGEDMYRRRGGKKTFQSSVTLQKFMLKNGLISLPTFYKNLAIRWTLLRLAPNWLRGWIYQTFAREK